MTLEVYIDQMFKEKWVVKYHNTILPIYFFGGLALMIIGCAFWRAWESPSIVLSSALLSLCMIAWASLKSFNRTAFVLNVIFLSAQVIVSIYSIGVEVFLNLYLVSSVSEVSGTIFGAIGAISSGFMAIAAIILIVFRLVQLGFCLIPLVLIVKNRSIFNYNPKIGEEW